MNRRSERLNITPSSLLWCCSQVVWSGSYNLLQEIGIAACHKVGPTIYSKIMSWLRCKLAFSLLRSSINVSEAHVPLVVMLPNRALLPSTWPFMSHHYQPSIKGLLTYLCKHFIFFQCITSVCSFIRKKRKNCWYCLLHNQNLDITINNDVTHVYQSWCCWVYTSDKY